MKIESFFDKNTFTVTYIVYDQDTKDAVIIDPVYDYNSHSGKLSQTSLERYISFIKQNSLNLHYILETHAHADHLSSSQLLKEIYPQAKIGVSKHIKIVQETFKDVFNMKDLNTDGSQFDHLFNDQEIFQAGSLSFKVLETPGHTPACISFLIEDNVFTGDALFMPDFGTGRCDFPAGCATDLYNSIKNVLYKLPDETKVFVGHDYAPGGREYNWETTIGESKKSNKQLTANTTQEEFVEFRKTRDATLDAPKLLLPSIQVNIDAGKLPIEEDNGVSYLKLPLSK